MANCWSSFCGSGAQSVVLPGGVRRSTFWRRQGPLVHAVVSGTIRRLFLSKPGGNTIYRFDEKGCVLHSS
jgi:hypothetical protein